jgi:hypothetical protein
MQGTQVTQGFFSEYLNSFYHNWVGAKGYPKISFRQRAWGGVQRKTSHETRAGLCLWLCLKGLRKGIAGLLFLFHFQNRFPWQTGHSQSTMTLWKAGGGRWASVKMWSIWDLSLGNSYRPKVGIPTFEGVALNFWPKNWN